ncbi:hypothetical protein BaRGS_00023124, partial [Batillaria attramentaria]
MDCVANGMACDPAGTKKCCEGNKCELDPKTNTNVCKFQCTKLNELCQPVADPEFDMCCEGTKCDYSTTSKAFVCIPKDLEPVHEKGEATCILCPVRGGRFFLLAQAADDIITGERSCLEPGSSCSSAGKPCCSPANCVSGTCSSEPECLKEGSQCSSSGTACCSPANCVSGTCRTEPQCLKEYATCYTFGTRCCEGMTCTNYKCRKPDSQPVVVSCRELEWRTACLPDPILIERGGAGAEESRNGLKCVMCSMGRYMWTKHTLLQYVLRLLHEHVSLATMAFIMAGLQDRPVTPRSAIAEQQTTKRVSLPLLTLLSVQINVPSVDVNKMSE